MLKLHWRAAGLLVCALIAGSAEAARRPQTRASDLDGLEAAVLREVNFARTRPQDYARALMDEGGSDRSARSSFAYEDPRDLYEAVDFLQRQRPLPPLSGNGRLGEAALTYVSVQGAQGGVGHAAMGQSLGERLRSRGFFASLMAENISYGYSDARDVVRQLIVDSGVPGRGHRNNIFGRYEVAGIGCGPHRVYGAMCVIDFAGGVSERQTAQR